MNFDPKDLSGQMVEKHENLVKQYSKESENIGKIIVLEEKVDQLSHWAKDGGKFKKEMEKSSKELKKLKEGVEVKSPRSRVKALEKKIEEHKEALDYWRQRNGGKPKPRDKE